VAETWYRHGRCLNASVNSAMVVKGTFWLRESHSEITLGFPGFMYNVNISWDRTGGVFSNTDRRV